MVLEVVRMFDLDSKKNTIPLLFLKTSFKLY